MGPPSRVANLKRDLTALHISYVWIYIQTSAVLLDAPVTLEHTVLPARIELFISDSGQSGVLVDEPLTGYEVPLVTHQSTSSPGQFRIWPHDPNVGVRGAQLIVTPLGIDSDKDLELA